MTTFALRKADCGQDILSGSLRETKSSHLIGPFTAILERLMTWQARAEMRSHLSTLEDHLLRDVGLTREEAVAEAAKPFWQA